MNAMMMYNDLAFNQVARGDDYLSGSRQLTAEIGEHLSKTGMTKIRMTASTMTAMPSVTSG
jgi:hypothetical protein